MLDSPIAFHPASVVFETPTHAELLEKTGVRPMITGVIDELLTIAKAQGCQFKPSFREHIMEQMIIPSETNSVMYQDFLARRPMEVETFLGSPIKLAQEVNVPVPRIETLYALLHNINIVNQTRPSQQAPPSPVAVQQPQPPPAHPRTSSMGGPMPPRGPPYVGPNGRPPMNGMRSGSRAPSQQGGPPPMGRRGPPSMNGYPPRGMNGYGPRGPPTQMRRPSFEGNDLEEFSHVMLYENMQDGPGAGGPDVGYDMANGSHADFTLRERELALREKEMALRQREMQMRRGPGRMPPPGGYDDDDEDGDDYFDPAGPNMGPPMDENFDMMSVTSRRTRKAPSASQLRSNPEMGGPIRNGRGPAPWQKRPPPRSNRTSAAIMNEMPKLREQLMNDPLMGYSSDRYGNVDRHNIGQESRTNSLTAERLSELTMGPGGPGHNGFGGPQRGPYPGPMDRRGSQSPGNPLSPGQRPNLRPSPPNGYGNGRPSPPGMRQPVPRHPPGHGNAVAPQQIEQQTGVSNLYPPKASFAPQVRSLTGSASASAGSGESNRSAPLDSEPSAHSSNSSLGPRPPIGVR